MTATDAETDWNLKHREDLLIALADELKRREQVMESDPGGPGRRCLDLCYLKVRFLDAAGEMLLDVYYVTALLYVVNDTYWNENGDWSDACRLEFHD